MPRNQQQQNDNQTPVLHSVLSTWRTSFLTFLLIVSSSTPHVINRLDVGNEVYQLLISSNRAFQVPPIVNNIAAVLPWLLESAPINHIHPLDVHNRIARVCFNNLLHNFYPITVWQNAEDAVMEYLSIRWGKRIHFTGFQHILLHGYYFIQRYYGYGFLYFAND